MAGTPRTTQSALISTMRYRDADAAVDWLCRAFGFETHAVYNGKDGKVMHAELSFGSGMIMLGPNVDSPFGQFMMLPGEAGGRCTQTIYCIVADADAHHARAVQAGAEIVMPLRDQDYGSREYSCRDPEGHVWTFGTYDPRAGKPG